MPQGVTPKKIIKKRRALKADILPPLPTPPTHFLWVLGLPKLSPIPEAQTQIRHPSPNCSASWYSEMRHLPAYNGTSQTTLGPSISLW